MHGFLIWGRTKTHCETRWRHAGNIGEHERLTKQERSWKVRTFKRTESIGEFPCRSIERVSISKSLKTVFVLFFWRYFNRMWFKSRYRYRVIVLFRKELKFYNNFENTTTTKIVVCPEFSIASKRQQGTVGQTVFIFSEFQVYRLDQSKSSVVRFVSIPRHESSFISNFKYSAYEKTNEL